VRKVSRDDSITQPCKARVPSPQGVRPAGSFLYGALALDGAVALAQGGLAVVLGALARALGGAHEVAGAGPAMTSLSRWAARVPGFEGRSAVALAMLGLGLVAARGVATVALARTEEREAFRSATEARLQLLAARLDGARAVGLGDALAWPAEVERGVRHRRARLRAIVQLAVLAVVAIGLDPKLAGMLLVGVVPFALLLRPARRALRAAQREAAQGVVELVDATRDVVEHAALWASCGGASTATRRVSALGLDGLALSTRAAMASAFASMSNEVLAGIAVLVLVSAFAPAATEARPTLLPVLVALVSAYRPLRDLAEASAGLTRADHAQAQLARLAPARAPSEGRARWPSGPLELRGVRLDVGGERVRGGVTVRVEPGRVLALTGLPGAGKSALLEAIVGARDRSAGELWLGDARFDGAPMGPRHRPIAWVPSAPPVLPGTLAENLAPDAPNDATRILRARAVLASLGDRVLGALADDAPLGPRGHRPSSGEAQRLALARALAGDAPVLLLDEPTASLDAAGEALAIEAIRACARGEQTGRARAVVLVSHRPAPLALADERLALDTPDEPAQLDARGAIDAPKSARNIGPAVGGAC
jgi:ABC-type multidrug transport system fused ATPase/permease subunit